MASLSWFLSLSVWERPSSQIAPRQCFPKRHLFCKSLVPNDFLKTLFFFFKGKIPFCLCMWGFPAGSVGKESACSAGDLGLIPGSGRSPEGGHGYPLQYSCLESPMDRGAWQATVYRVTKSWAQLKQLSMHIICIHWIFQEYLCLCNQHPWEETLTSDGPSIAFKSVLLPINHCYPDL